MLFRSRAGDRIFVANGVYREQVVIDKPIKLQGTSPEKTIIDGERSTTLSDRGQVRIVAAGDVELANFTVRNAGSSGQNPSPAAIYTQSPVAGVKYDIHEMHLIGWNDPNGDNDFGLVSISGLEHLNFHHSQIEGTISAPVYLEDHFGAVTLQDSHFTIALNQTAASGGVFFARSSGSTDDIVTPQRIMGNTIDAGTGNSSFYPAGLAIIGWGLATWTDMEISGNTIEHITPNRRGINFISGGAPRAIIKDNAILREGGYSGIAVWGPCEDVRVEGNLITGITGEPAPGQNGGIRLRDGSGVGGLFGAPVRTRIVNNVIEAYRGITVESNGRFNQITDNRVSASGPATVVLGADTSNNSVVQNQLRTPLDQIGRAHV